MKTGDEIREVLAEATTVVGALKDALDEAVNGSGELVSTTAIVASLARAQAHAPRLASAVRDVHEEWTGRLLYQSAAEERQHG